MANILVCDDERSICELLDISLRRENHRVETVNSGEAAKRKIDGALYDVIVTDIKMPKIDGIEVLRYAHQISPDSAVILITAVDDYEAAVEAVKAGGAADYIRKSPGLVDEINSLEPVREPARGYILTGAEPTRQVVVATTATQLQWALVRIDVYLEHQPGVVPKTARQTKIHFDHRVSG